MTQGNQSGAAIKTPQTRAEFNGLQARRGELQDQLRSLEERRTQLAAQSNVTPPTERGALKQRIAALDERIPRIESELLQLDDAISKSVSNIAALEAPFPTPVGIAPLPGADHFPGVAVIPGGSGPSFGDVTTVVLGEALAFVLVGVAVWRYSLHRFEQRLFGKGGDPAQVARLQQSVDSIAVEVERISENQRYVTKLLGEKTHDAGAK
jgi:hypothetical protein